MAISTDASVTTFDVKSVLPPQKQPEPSVAPKHGWRENRPSQRRSPVLGEPHRSPTDGGHPTLMTPNPYQPFRADSRISRAGVIPRLNGFALGVRDGLVLSIPFVVIVGFVASSYGGSYFSILRTVVVIPLIWAPCAGFVAEFKYRRRVPNPSDRCWIELPNNDMIGSD